MPSFSQLVLPDAGHCADEACTSASSTARIAHLGPLLADEDDSDWLIGQDDQSNADERVETRTRPLQNAPAESEENMYMG